MTLSVFFLCCTEVWEGCSLVLMILAKGGFMPWWFSFCALLVLEVMNGVSTEYINSCARQLGAKRLRLELPWECAPLDAVFSRKKTTIPRPDWVVFPVQMLDSAELSSRPTRLDRYNTRLHLSDISWVAAENKKHNLALQCWKVIVLDSTSHTSLGRMLMHCIEVGKTEDYIWQVVADAFSQKSTSTLKSRAASLLAFGRWKRSTIIGERHGVFPISEELANEYLCELRRLHAAPSKGRRFLEAVGFSKGLLGAEVDSVLTSARVKGVAMGSASVPVKKKSPFSCEQVILLERIAFYGEGPESIFAGYICFLVHCRLRWSDGQHCIKEPELDVTDSRGFLEASLYHHKTAKKRRTQVVRLLPVAGVIPGLSGLNRAAEWLRKRLQAGLQASMNKPTMPAPIAGGEWSKVPLTASEASVWLRELLSPWTPEGLSNIATHSAKATILSWMSKSNVCISLRRLAGYHVSPGDKSALEYSRDAAAPILREIEAILIAIRAGIFCPDAVRSNRWREAQTLSDAVKLASSMESAVDQHAWDDSSFSFCSASILEPAPVATLDGEKAVESGPYESDLFGNVAGWNDDTTLDELRFYRNLNSNTVNQCGGLDASDISDLSDDVSSSTDEDSDSVDLDRQAELDGEKNATDLVAPSDLAGKICFRHVKSKKLHFVEKSLDGQQFFRCGRKRNLNYEHVEIVPAFTAHGCMMCFGWSTDRHSSDSGD